MKIDKKIVLSIILVWITFSCDATQTNSSKINFNKFPREVICNILSSVDETKEDSLRESIKNFLQFSLISKSLDNILQADYVQKLFINNCADAFGLKSFQNLFDSDIMTTGYIEKNRLFGLIKSVVKSENYIKTVRCLLKLNILSSNKLININARYKHQKTLLIQASALGYTEIVKMLCKYYAQNSILNNNILNIEAKDKNGCTALMLAVGNGHTEVVKILLKYKANANAKDKKGATVLMCAAVNGHHKIVKVLLEHGVNIYAHDQYRETALSYAINYKTREALRTHMHLDTSCKLL